MDICIWDKCNNFCEMCTNPDLPWKSETGKLGEGYDFESLVGRIKRLKNKIESDDAVILTGGEPTLHPQFLDVFNFVKKTFPRQELRLLTNGRRFAYTDFARKIMQTDNLNIAISLCGPNDQVHDHITKTKNSFAQAVKGIENILKFKKKSQTIEIRTVLSKLSYLHIKKTLELIHLKFPSLDRVIVIYLEVEGQAKKNLTKVMIPYSKVSPELKKITLLLSMFKEIRFYHFPLCTLDSDLWPYVWRTLPSNEVMFLPSCKKCFYKKYCLGIHRNHPSKSKCKEFKPLKKNILIQESNNFYHPIIKTEKE